MESKKVAKIFARSGAQIGVLTRMPLAEIERELYESQEPWITLEGLNASDERVLVRMLRDDFCVGIIEPFKPKPVTAP